MKAMLSSAIQYRTRHTVIVEEEILNLQRREWEVITNDRVNHCRMV